MQPMKYFHSIMAGIVLIFIGIMIISPHTLKHDWRWEGGDRQSFYADYGECRAQSSLGGFLNPPYDATTLHYLMYGRGWFLICQECGELK